MSHSPSSLCRFEYGLLAALFLAGWGVMIAGPQSACSATSGSETNQRAAGGRKDACVPVVKSKPKPSWPKRLRTRKGESFKGNPVISFDVDEAGNVKDAKVVGSSGIRDVDAWVLREVKRWKYEPGPSCGLRHGEAVVTIDLTSSRVD